MGRDRASIARVWEISATSRQQKIVTCKLSAGLYCTDQYRVFSALGRENIITVALGIKGSAFGRNRASEIPRTPVMSRRIMTYQAPRLIASHDI
jgi:hypothetical protein